MGAGGLAWARLIQKVYEVAHREVGGRKRLELVFEDPMLCPYCGSEMRIMALFEDEAIIEKILKHLHLWDPRPPSQGPPLEDIDWPNGSQILLTYAPLPDIA